MFDLLYSFPDQMSLDKTPYKREFQSSRKIFMLKNISSSNNG